LPQTTQSIIKSLSGYFYWVYVALFLLASLAFVLGQYISLQDPELLTLLAETFINPYFIGFAIIYACVVCWLHGRFKAILNRELTLFSQLENWANLSRIKGEVQAIDGTDSISTAIIRLQGKVHEAQNKDSHFDQMIRERALLDPETGVGNREFFSNRLEALLFEEDARGVVLLIQFKECDLVQALYGHQQALTILESCIHNIKHRLQYVANYFIARRAEFELALLLPGFHADGVDKLCQRLLQNLQAVSLPVGINREEFVHIGASYFSGKQKIYQIMSEADMALRSAQLQGPSQWFMYETGEIAPDFIKGSLKWRTFISQAIKNNAFVIFFQPVMASHSDKILHHEALSKVRDNEGSLISASVFLPMAQKCGLAADVDMLVFDHVCRLVQYERAQHDACSLNLSIDSLLSDKFKLALIDKLEQSPDIAPRLIIEISEYHLVSHLAELSTFIEKLHRLGVKLLADKVGQYVVSANYLKLAPISYIKLHRSIVLNIHQKPENQVFIQSLKTMCDKQGVDIYALGVESFEEWQTLVRIGVGGGQGHFFTEPVEQVAKAIHLP